jgi:hypothetical protein
MNATVSRLRPDVLEPEELEALGSAFDIVASIIPEQLQTPTLMDTIAKRMLVRAAAGKLNTTELYLESLCWLRFEQRMAI